MEFVIASVIVLFFGIGLHEYAHCKVADLSGDPTPAFHGRVTLNLTKHFELSGTLMMIFSSLTGFGLGWGKAAPVDPKKMNNPRWDLFATVAAGPVTNILQAAVYAMVFRFLNLAAPGVLAGSEFLVVLLYLGVLINLGMALFNLIPFGPLDGHWLVGELLPERQRWRWYRFHRGIGHMGLFMAILFLQMIGRSSGTNVLWSVLGPPVDYMFRFLMGFENPFF